MSKPILLKTLHAVCSKSPDSTVLGMLTPSTHANIGHLPSIIFQCSLVVVGGDYLQFLQFERQIQAIFKTVIQIFHFCPQRVYSGIRLIMHF